MSGFEALLTAQNATVAQEQIRADQVAFTGQELDDITALQIVTQDVQLAEAFINSKRQPQQWESADNTYRAVVTSKPWEGSDTPRSNLSIPVVLEAVESLMPTCFLAFFSDRQPFLLEPLGKTTPEAARAQEKVLLWAVQESGFKEEIRRSLKQWLLQGFTAVKWGWKTETRTQKKYVREGGKVQKAHEDYEISHPTIGMVDLRNILFDPSLREQDCRKGKWVCAQVFVTANDLDEMRDDPSYKNIPSRAELAEILARKDEPTEDSLQESKFTTNRDLQALPQKQESTVDPLGQPLELLEYVTDDNIITVLQRKIVIRNEGNDFDKKNFLSCAFVDVLGSMYGFGISKLGAGEQRLQTGVMNKMVDVLALIMNPSFQLKKGLGPGTQNIPISPGKVINETGELIPLEVASVTKEALEAIESSEARLAKRIGSNGGDNMPTQAMRTAEGVNSFNQGVVDKLQYCIEIFADMIFIPALEAFLEVCKDNLQPDDINKILSDVDGKAYQGDILDLYNGGCRVQVLSSTKLASRRAAAQLLPMILQLVQAAPVQTSLASQNMKFNYAELLDEALNLTGWDVDSLIVPATPQEVQQYMQMTTGGSQAGKVQAQAAAQSQLESQKNQDVLQQIEATGFMKSGVEVIKHALNESAKPPEDAIQRSTD
jgi:hypothetical protein